MDYELHPLCTLFPRLSGAELDALAADIKANGLREPIMIHNGLILDGGNRYVACLMAGVKPRFRQFDGGNIVAFVLSANLHRRHLSPGQQAAIVASAQDWAKAHAPGGDRKSDQSATLHFDSASDRAAQSGASLRTQKMADKVAKADPDLAKKVGHGEVSLPQAVAAVDMKAGKKKLKRQIDAPPEGIEAPSADDEVLEARHTIRELAEENERLKDRIAVESMDASEEAKTEASRTIAELRERVRTLEIECDALRESRDRYQAEVAQMKRQLAAQRREIDRLKKLQEAA